MRMREKRCHALCDVSWGAGKLAGREGGRKDSNWASEGEQQRTVKGQVSAQLIQDKRGS